MSVNVTTSQGNTVDVSVSGGNTVSFTQTSTSISVSSPSVSTIIVTEKGPKGDTGATGATGATGSTGERGLDATTYSISCVDGDNSDEEKIRLTGSDSSTDDVVLEAGTGLSIARSGDKITFTNTVTDTDTVLSAEQVQDIVGAMFSGNTETRISVTYDDSDGTIDLAVDDMTANTQLSDEQVQDIVGAMFSGNTETRISATYQDADGTIDLAVDDMTANDNTTYSISCVDGDNSDEEKIRLTDSNGSTDDIVLEAGTGLSIARSSDKITFTNTVSDTNTTYTAGTGLDLSGGNEFSVDVSDFMTNGTDDRIVTATGTDAMNAEANLTFDGSQLTVAGSVRAASILHAISGNNAGDFGPGAEILTGISDDSVTAGEIYVLRNGVWTLIDADLETTTIALAAVATSAAAASDSSAGMLIRGAVTLNNAYTAGTDKEGAPVYASATAGEATLTAPSSSGQFVRLLGFSLNVSDKKMFFNPDNTFVEIA